MQANQLELLFTSRVLLAAEHFYRVTEENNALPCLLKQKYCSTALRQRGSSEGHAKKQNIRLKAE